MDERRFQLRLFGGFALDDPSGEAILTLPQRRSEATLAMLAVAGDLGCARERLMAFLWPESPDSRARHNLRDALYAVRQALGRDAVQGSGDTLRLDRSIVRSDVEAFGTALNEGRLAEAVGIYRGPFLEGFHVNGAREFDRWVEDERAQFAHERQKAAKALAKEAERGGRFDEAADWWALALAGDRFNSRLMVRRMVAMTRAGDRANAIMEGEKHCRDLKKELDLDPDPTLLEELERIRKGGVGPPQFFTPLPFPRSTSDDAETKTSEG